jgi:glycosyltransferase involved in cell wall biosynthesis
MNFIHERMGECGHEIEFLCAENVSRLARGRWGRLVFPWVVRARLRAAQRAGAPFDIVNVHEPSGAVVSLLRGAREPPVVVVTTHGVEQRAWELWKDEARLGREGPRLRTRLLYPATVLWQARMALRHADHVFCLNDEDQVYLQSRFGLPETRITRIYPGADPAFAAAATKRSYAGADRILFAATWRKNKGIEDLVPAFTRLAERNPTVTLTVLGGGVPPVEIQAAFPSQVRGRVVCVQARNDTETAAQFAASDLFVLPSLFEGTPLTLIEAMMSGLPIVTTATCGMKDVIQHERNGLLIPIRSPEAIGAAVERLREGAKLRARLGSAAQQDAMAQYTWPVVARRVVETYERLAQTAIK